MLDFERRKSALVPKIGTDEGCAVASWVRYIFGGLSDEETSGRVVALDETAWAQLLFALLSQRFTGRAELDEGDLRRRIVFRGGFAVWTDFRPTDSDAQTLRDAEGLSEDELASLASVDLDRVVATLGSIAVREGVDDVWLALRDQCEARLIATADNPGPWTLFDEPGIDASVLEHFEPGRMLRVINRGIRHACSPSQAEASLAHLQNSTLSVAPAYEEYAERFGFEAGARAALARLVEKRTFRAEDLRQISGLDSVRGAQLLYTLWACRMLVETATVVENDRSAAPSPSASHSGSSLAKDLIARKLESDASPYEVLSVDPDATLDDLEAALTQLQAKAEGQLSVASVEALRGAAHAQREAFARGKIRKVLSDQRWTQAVEVLGDLSKLAPDDVAVGVDFAWARWNRVERRGEAEARALDEAISACSDVPDGVAARAQFYRGYLRKHQGRRSEALTAFERAAELDDRLVDAKREARALSAGTDSEPQPSKKSKASAEPARSPSKKVATADPRSKYWSGIWPYVWVVSGALLVVMVAAQVVLRLDVDL